MSKIRVVLADDHQAMLARVREELGEHFEVVAAVSNGAEALKAIAAFDPDVLVTVIPCRSWTDFKPQPVSEQTRIVPRGHPTVYQTSVSDSSMMTRELRFIDCDDARLLQFWHIHLGVTSENGPDCTLTSGNNMKSRAGFHGRTFMA